MPGRMSMQEILAELEAMGDPANAEGMARFGITPTETYGVRMPDLRKLGGRIGTDHGLASELWRKAARETRILASLVDDPALVTPEQMDCWAGEFTYWEICDQCCMNLFWRTAVAYEKTEAWSGAEEEYVKRAGFALMAVLAWKDKDASDEAILAFLPVIEREADDGRAMVKKAVDWALRQVGKRDATCHGPATDVARRLTVSDDPSAAWVGRHALKELESEAVARRLAGRG